MREISTSSSGRVRVSHGVGLLRLVDIGAGDVADARGGSQTAGLTRATMSRCQRWYGPEGRVMHQGGRENGPAGFDRMTRGLA